MKLSLRRDIDAPTETVFSEISTFDAIERRARARGIAIRRLDDGAGGPAAARWDLRFDLHGRPRQARAHVVLFAPDEQIALKADFDGISALGNVELQPLSADRTRLFGTVDMRPSTLGARLLIQSLKLARGSLERRLASRLDTFARRLETGAD